ncbi:hypothetical protein [Actibacterium sp. XHP0104]|uniref:hypothetical protein n=1 Tax=Actibacterium sp. XHP0104 TaxID=2984335 RepID=UPI0021E98FF3|nr:hypothetical protein [Actibacterium sp. XHP0104]MCV2881897.1 hypothetical protein [Actibacterium sp. XHP0104]
MVSYVVSAPRSGMNWLRYCVEHFHGVRTPGKTSLIAVEDDPSEAFQRSHDALNLTKRRQTGVWQRLDPAAMQDARVALILRDPLETYARMSKRALHRFKCYTGNIQFYARANAPHKAVFYYDELVSDPDRMADLLEFLAIPVAEGREPPTRRQIADEWEELGAQSRSQYDVKQAVGGGSQTKDAPGDFKFHQRGLSDWHKRRAWRFVRGRLSDAEFALLDRFNPPQQIPRPGLLDRITDIY